MAGNPLTDSIKRTGKKNNGRRPIGFRDPAKLFHYPQRIGCLYCALTKLSEATKFQYPAL